VYSLGLSAFSTFDQVVQAAMWRPVQIEVAKAWRKTLPISKGPAPCFWNIVTSLQRGLDIIFRSYEGAYTRQIMFTLNLDSHTL
jgi:hypothetical protein